MHVRHVASFYLYTALTLPNLEGRTQTVHVRVDMPVSSKKHYQPQGTWYRRKALAYMVHIDV